MEWNRGSGPTQPANQPVNHTAAPTTTVTKKDKMSYMNLQVASVGLIFCIAILILALVGYVVFGLGSPAPASRFVNKTRMQAVFLNGGQVYFGHISNLSDKFMRVSDIYYLRVNQAVQPDGSSKGNQDVSLVKLGCELHGPDDSMVINQQQVIFWENLKTDGQVAKAVADYNKQNPNGQKCDAAASTPTTSPTTPTSTPPATNTPTTPTTKKP